MAHDIVFSQDSQVGLVTLNRVAALNALTLPMIQALQQQLKVWQQDDTIHAVIIQAAEGRAFCAGGDVRWLYEKGKAHSPEQLQFFEHEYRLNHCIHQYKKPYIALMDGVTMGGGVGIGLHGSHPVASERFVFAMPETSIGFFPDIGASYLLSRCPGALGVYLGLTGNRLSAVDAAAVGLVNYVISAAHFSDVIASIVASDLSVDAHARVDACLQRFVTHLPEAPITPMKAAVDACFSASSMEEIISQLAKSATPWHQDTLATLKQKAPLSLKVVLAQLHKAKSLSLAQCLAMDYELVQHFMHGYDFYEGVRALLVDKDKNPQWQPNSLAQVSEAMVDAYFITSGEALKLQQDMRELRGKIKISDDYDYKALRK